MYNVGTIPLGLRVDENKRYQIDEKTAPIVRKIFEMYANGEIMADIIRYLNSKNIKTVLGNEFNKCSIHNMLFNKKYIGTYTYNGVETPNAFPAVIEDDLFCRVQDMLKNNKKSPARAKAKTEYLLTTKLFCGECKEMMIGTCGTSKTGKVYNYYACNGVKKKICKKKNVPKEYIEDIIVQEARNILSDKNIEKIASEIVKFSEKSILASLEKGKPKL